MTSDRIVVMNRGPIEQIDDPVSMYHRPRTRFSAGGIGRTNLMDGKRDGNRIVFPGFDTPAHGAPAGAGSGARFLVGPQSIVLAPVSTRHGGSPGGSRNARILANKANKSSARPTRTLRLRVCMPPWTLPKRPRSLDGN